MITITTPSYVATIYGVYNVGGTYTYYRREACRLVIEPTTTVTMITMFGAQYYTVANVMDVLISDYLRYNGDTTLAVSFGGSTYTICAIKVVEGISPNNVVMPFPDFAVVQYPYTLEPLYANGDQLGNDGVGFVIRGNNRPLYNDLQVVPPSVIYMSDRYNADVLCEVRGVAETYVWDADGAPVSVTGNSLRVADGISVLTGAYGTIDYHWNIERLKACADACVLRWESLTGITKQAIWRVKKHTYNTDNALSYMTAGNGYDVRKGLIESLTAYIEGLSRYDYAYYADIVTSPKVSCIFSNEDGSISSDMQGVEVTLKKITIPDNNSGQLYTIEVELNYRHYDGEL